jgi:hypothetical protein
LGKEKVFLNAKLLKVSEKSPMYVVIYIDIFCSEGRKSLSSYNSFSHVVYLQNLMLTFGDAVIITNFTGKIVVMFCCSVADISGSN